MYKQRYFVSDKYWDQVNGPIFIYVCGEWTCEIPETKAFPYQLAKEYKALYFIVEHRYYGKSQLFNDWTVKNMNLLTVQLALADLAYFIQEKQKEILLNHYYGPPRRKVITIGGSYPGAMVAWFRYKYPHITDGSWASSGVVNVMYQFPEFDRSIIDTMSLSPGC